LLKLVSSALNVKLSKSEIKKLFEEADIDDSQTIDQREFVKMIYGLRIAPKLVDLYNELRKDKYIIIFFILLLLLLLFKIVFIRR
jgi:hypothetical protein